MHSTGVLNKITDALEAYLKKDEENSKFFRE